MTNELSSTFRFQSHSSSSYAHPQSAGISPTVLPSSPSTVHQITETSDLTPEHSQPSDVHRTQAITIAVLVIVTLLLVLVSTAVVMCVYQRRSRLLRRSKVDDKKRQVGFLSKQDLFPREEIASPILCTGQSASSDEALSDFTGLYMDDYLLFRPSSCGSDRTVEAMDILSVITDTNDPERETIFVVYSNVSSEVDHKVIYFLAFKLIPYLSVTMEILELPIKGSYPTWVNETVKKCSLVLCVCNQQFQEDWDMGREGSLVCVVKHLYEGSMMHDDKQAMSKYAVVLLHKEDSQFIPSFLQGHKCFMFTESKVTATVEEIVCYVRNTPLHCF